MSVLNDPQRWAAWLLVLAALGSAAWTFSYRLQRLRENGQPYRIWQRLQDLALPAGMGLLGLRGLLLSYGVFTPNSSGSRVLLALAMLLMAGGLMAARIRRTPML